jgi:hypothetical protein
MRMKEVDAELLAHGTPIGRCLLREGDRSAGVATGQFIPNGSYDPLIHAWCIGGSNNDTPARVPLIARDRFGQTIEAHGVDVHDYSATLGEREVHVIGIPLEAFEAYFGPSV